MKKNSNLYYFMEVYKILTNHSRFLPLFKKKKISQIFFVLNLENTLDMEYHLPYI